MWKEGEAAKRRKATETVHGQHQAVNKNDNITAAEDRRRWKEIVSRVMVANGQT